MFDFEAIKGVDDFRFSAPAEAWSAIRRLSFSDRRGQLEIAFDQATGSSAVHG
jgi:hypothetical protein